MRMIIEGVSDDSMQGRLKGFDQLTNIILDKCFERVYSPTGVEQVALGLYIIRGDNVYAFYNSIYMQKESYSLANEGPSLVKLMKNWTKVLIIAKCEQNH